MYTNSNDEPSQTYIRQTGGRNLSNELQVGDGEFIVTINGTRTSTKCKSKPITDRDDGVSEQGKIHHTSSTHAQIQNLAVDRVTNSR